MAVLERKTGLVKMQYTTKKTAYLIADAMVNMLTLVRLQVKIIAPDNRKEFADYKEAKGHL